MNDSYSADTHTNSICGAWFWHMSVDMKKDENNQHGAVHYPCMHAFGVNDVEDDQQMLEDMI